MTVRQSSRSSSKLHLKRQWSCVVLSDKFREGMEGQEFVLYNFQELNQNISFPYAVKQVSACLLALFIKLVSKLFLEQHMYLLLIISL